MAKISIIVPIYKVEPYLRRCIDSILNQTYADYEVILVDDGSPDICPAICDEYALQYDNIIVIHKPNGGLSDARNAGIDWSFQNSSSDWISFIDSDDWIHPRFFEILYNSAINQQVNIAISDFQRVSSHIEYQTINDFNTSLYDPLDFYVEFKTTATIACSKLYRKELFQNIRYPVGRLHEDEFTTHKLLYLAGPVAYVQCPLYFYFYNEASIMHQEYSPRKLDAVDACEEQQLFFQSIGRDDLVKQWDRNIQGYYAFHYIKLKENGWHDIAEKLRVKAKKHLRKMKQEKRLKLFSDIDLYQPFYPFESKVISLILRIKKGISRTVFGKGYRRLRGH